MYGAIYQIQIQRRDASRVYYFGQSIQPKERWSQHLRALRAGRHDNIRMQRAYRKYGEAAFSFRLIIVCEPDAKVMSCYEQAVLDCYLDLLGGGFVLNVMRECVNTHLRVKRRPETIAKMSAAQKGRKKSPEQIKAMSARQIGVGHSPEVRAKISASHKKIPQHPNSILALTAARNSPARLDALRAALGGRKKVHSDETRAKIAASLTGRKQSPELIEKRIAPLRGRKKHG